MIELNAIRPFTFVDRMLELHKKKNSLYQQKERRLSVKSQ